jgi:hypothetical protein
MMVKDKETLEECYWRIFEELKNKGVNVDTAAREARKMANELTPPNRPPSFGEGAGYDVR